MNINSMVLIGNLVDSPEVQVTNAGTSRARFRVASTERRRDPATETWQDGESVFMDVTCWRRLAENVANSLEKGDRVIVSGRLRQWVAEREGVRRTVHEIEADAVGPDLQRGIVSVARRRTMSPPTDAAGEVTAPAPDEVGVDLETGEIPAQPVDRTAVPDTAPDFAEAQV